MKSWKDKWIKELDSVLPEKCSSAPVVNNEQKQNGASVLTKRLTTTNVLILAVVLIMTAILGVFVFFPRKTATVFALQINPSVVFALDKEGIVTDVTSVNFDADVILSDQSRREQMVGKSAENAANVFVDYAISLGYLDLSFDEMTVTGVNEVAKKVKASIEKHLKNKGGQVVVDLKTQKIEEFAKILGANVNNVEQLIKNIKDKPTLYSDKHAQDKTIEELKQDYKNQIDQYVKKHVLHQLEKDQTLSTGIKESIIALLERTDFIQEIYKIIEENKINDLIPEEMWGVINGEEPTSKEDYQSKMQNLTELVYNDRCEKHGNTPGGEPSHTPGGDHGGVNPGMQP